MNGRSTGEFSRNGESPPRPTKALVIMASGLVVLALCFRTTIRGDGVPYYSFLPAVIAHGSLDLNPIYAKFLAAGVPVAHGSVNHVLANGMTADYKSVGSALLALPFYLIVYLCLLAAGPITGRPTPDPTLGEPYQLSFTLASLFYVVLTLFLIYAFIRRRWGSWPALLSVVSVLFATPLVVYVLFEPAYSHTFSVFTITVFAMLLYQTTGSRALWQWALLGVLGALVVLVHYQEGLFLLLVPSEGLWLIMGRSWRRGELMGYAVFAAALLLCMLPQAVVNLAIFGTWLPVAAPNISIDLLHPRLIEMLLSPHHGWLLWSPSVLIALLGLPMVVRALGWFATAMIAICVADVYFNASLSDWYGGAAFGARRLTDQTFLLAMGFAAFFAWLHTRGPRALAPALTIGGVCWSVLLIARFYYVSGVDNGLPWSQFLAGIFDGLPFVPHLFVQGTVVRDVFASQILPAAAVAIAVAGAVGLAVRAGTLAVARLRI